MIKHSGQYACSNCTKAFENKNDLKVHIQDKHSAQHDESSYDCTECDKSFTSEHSLKQHMNSKHKKTDSLPVGHPDRVREREQESQEPMRFV